MNPPHAAAPVAHPVHGAPPAPAAPSTPPGASPVTPERIFTYGWSYALTRGLSTAVEIDLFSHVAAGKNTPAAIAKAAGVPEKGARMLVDLLVAMGLLVRPGGAGTPVTLAPDADTFLVKGKPSYVGDFLVFHGGQIDENWRHLTDVVRTGKPAMAVDVPKEGIPLWHALVDGLFAVGFKAATQVGEELARLYPGKDVRLLDVAAGSGVWGYGAATANPRIRVTTQDLPETLEHARRWAQKTGLEERVEWLPGDLRQIDFGTAKFEAATLGHILHSEGEEHAKRLLQKVAKALVPGGTIVIAEFNPDPDRNGPLIPVVFALNMLVNTTSGDAFTFPQIASWLTEAGFKDARQMPAPAPSPLILATRK